jgi:hypothetical protein
MFEHPSRDLLAQGVTDFVFPSWWVNVPPFILATQVLSARLLPLLNSWQIQQGFSRYYGVNLLASNSGASWFNGGSGVYSRGNALAQYYNTSYLPSARMVLVEVPELSRESTAFLADKQRSTTVPPLMTSPPSLIPGARINVLPFEAGKAGCLNVTASGLLCSVSWKFGSDSDSVAGAYAVVSFSGVYNELHLQLCGLVACDSPSTCGQVTLSAM